MQMTDAAQAAREQADAFRTTFRRIRESVQRMMVGQSDVIDGVLTALMAGGHVLLEGVPGLGKTMLVSSISRAVDLPFSRIQFTPDMLPSDITGVSIYNQHKGKFEFRAGPIIGQIIKLAVSRQREYQADAQGVLYTRYPPGLVSALRKIEAASEIPMRTANNATAHLWLSQPSRVPDARRPRLCRSSAPLPAM